jgi:chromosome segregation ATPase
MEGQHSARKKESFQDSLDAANQTVRELQSQCKSLEELLASEQGDARRRLQEHEEVVAGLKRIIKEATTRSSGLEEKLHKLELTLTSERVNTTHLREVNENLEMKLQSTSEKLTATTEELEAVTVRHQKQIVELRQQLKESEVHRRALSDREGASQRELTASLRAAEDTNRLLREDLASIATEVGKRLAYGGVLCVIRVSIGWYPKCAMFSFITRTAPPYRPDCFHALVVLSWSSPVDHVFVLSALYSVRTKPERRTSD